MGYIKQSLIYYKKNLLYVLLLSLVPAIIVGAGTEPCSMLQFFINFTDGNYKTFGDIFLAQSEVTWRSFLIGVLVFPLIIASISAFAGMISRHMRYGVLDFDNFTRRINNNFLQVFLLSIIFLVLTQIYAIICTSITLVWVTTIDVNTTSLALTIVTNLIFMAILLMIFAFCSVALPIMSISGLGIKKALAESIRLVKTKILKVIVAIVVPLIIPYTIMGVLAGFDFWWRKIINPFIFLFIIGYIMILMYIIYCDVADFDREDVKDKYVLE